MFVWARNSIFDCFDKSYWLRITNGIRAIIIVRSDFDSIQKLVHQHSVLSIQHLCCFEKSIKLIISVLINLIQKLA